MRAVYVGLLPLHVQQMDNTNHWLLAATIVEEEEELAAIIVEWAGVWQPPMLTTKQEQLPWNAYK
jgi:hypothetical protein